MTALVRTEDNEIINVWRRPPGRIDLPGVGQVSPVVEGWEGHGYKIVPVTWGTVPEGKRATERSYSVDRDAVVENLTLEDIPPEPVLTAEERVQRLAGSFDLTVQELKSVLDATTTSTTREKA